MAPTLTTPTLTSTPSSGRTAAPVRLRGVRRTFETRTGPRTVLCGVDLDIVAGEIVALIGASGCGKSTLLRQICGLDTPDSGEILIGGTAVHGADARCAVAFQEPRLLPWRSLAENVALGLPPGTSSRGGRERVAELLRLVELSAHAEHRPRQVSGGMAQRASLARALARNPAVLLLDEPFGALDALTRLRMQDLLLDVHAAEPTTVVLVTHDVDEALYLADRIAVIGAPQAGDLTGRADPGAADGAGIRSLTTVPGPRPRDRADVELAGLKVRLLADLGVTTHHRPAEHQGTHA